MSLPPDGTGGGARGEANGMPAEEGKSCFSFIELSCLEGGAPSALMPGIEGRELK